MKRAIEYRYHLIILPLTGLKPKQKRKGDLPKPTAALKAREAPLELNKNEGKSMMVEGKRGTGFYCEPCNRMCKDSARYLDHINGRMRESPRARQLFADC